MKHPKPMKTTLLIYLSLLALWGLSLPSVNYAQNNLTTKWLNELDEEQLEQSGTAITIIFDDSGSMRNNNKIGQAKRAFLEWLSTVPENYRLSLIALNRGLLAPLGPNNRELLMAKVEALQAGGGTPLIRTLSKALSNIKERRKQVGPYERHVVIVFTDGQESSKSGNEGVQKQILNLRNNQVEVAGIGFHGQGDYMKNVSTSYFSAETTEQLKQGLQKVDAEIGDVSDIKITEEDFKIMDEVSLNPTPSASLDNNLKKNNPLSSATASKKKENGFSFGNFFVLLIVGWVLYKVFSFAKKAGN